MCINESVVLFRGRIKFRQYLKNKRLKYGIKIFKLCSGDFYIRHYKNYASKELIAEIAVFTKVVLELIKPYLHVGRVLFVDDWYTSVTLPHKLTEKKIHVQQHVFFFTLHANRKGNPKFVTTKKLKKGELKLIKLLHDRVVQI